MSKDVADQSVTELSAGERPSTLPRMVVVNKLPPLEVFRAGLTLIALGVGCYLLWRVQDVLFLLILAILLATAIEPLVFRLRRGPFARGSGVLVVYTVIVIIIGVPAYIVVPNLISQAASFPEAVPERLQKLRPYAENMQPRQLQSLALGVIDNAAQAVQTPAAPAQAEIVQVGTTAAHTLLSFFSVFVLAYYWLVERPLIKRVILRTVPVRHARGVNTVWMEVEEKLGG